MSRCPLLPHRECLWELFCAQRGNWQSCACLRRLPFSNWDHMSCMGPRKLHVLKSILISLNLCLSPHQNSYSYQCHILINAIFTPISQAASCFFKGTKSLSHKMPSSEHCVLAFNGCVLQHSIFLILWHLDSHHNAQWKHAAYST